MTRESIPVRVIRLLVLISAIPTAVPASPWAIVANAGDGTIHTIDLGRNPPQVYGPFLSGELVLSAGLGTVAVVPGERYALVKNSGGPIYLVDISNPTAPVLARTINTREFGGDLSISPSGLFTIPTFEVVFVIVDLTSFAVSGRVLTASKLFRPSCVLVTDDSTVGFCDATNDRLVYGRVSPTFADLETEEALPTGNQPRNAVVSKDGQTVIVGNSDDTVSVFRVTGPGTLAPGTPPTISGLPGNQDSFVVEPSGRRVFVLSTAGSADRISILEIMGPGVVRLEEAGAFTLPSESDSLSGIERMAITPAGDRLIVGSILVSELTVVNLLTGAISTIPTGGRVPLGVATFQGPVEALEPIPALSPTLLLILAIALAAVGGFLGNRATG